MSMRIIVTAIAPVPAALLLLIELFPSLGLVWFALHQVYYAPLRIASQVNFRGQENFSRLLPLVALGRNII